VLKGKSDDYTVRMVVIFDTHTWVKRLKEVDFTEEQAEAEVSLVREALSANLKDLVTKDYLAQVRQTLMI
jgi:hypothetical protein